MGKTNFDELVLDKQPAITVTNASNVSASYNQTEVQSIVTLVNDIKAKLNAIFKG